MRKGKKKDSGKLKIFLIIAIIIILALSGAFFVKFAVSGLIAGTTYAVKTDMDKRVVQGCEQKLEDMTCSRWTSCVDNQRSRTCRDLSGCLPFSGHFVEVQECTVDIKTGSINTGPIIADFCDNDNECEDNENYILCPNDCSANGKDNLCNDKENGICDPDCGSYDKDCIKFPKATKFSPELSTNFSKFDSFVLKNLELGIKEKGIILFKDVVDVSGADLDRYVNINYNLVNVNVKELPKLNASARITLFNIVFNETAILFNGKLCKECKIRKFKNGTLIFDVKQMGSYRAEDKRIAEGQFSAKTMNVSGWSFFNTIIIILLSVLILAGAVYAYMNNYNKKLMKKLEKNKLVPKIGKKFFNMKTETVKQPKEIGLRPKQLMEIKPFPKIKPHKKRKLAIPIIVVKKKKQKIQKVRPKTIVVKRLTIKPYRKKSKVMFPVNKLPKLRIPKDPYKEERLMRQRAAKKRLETMKKNARKKTKKKTTVRRTKKKQTKKKTVKRTKRKVTKKKTKKKTVKRRPAKRTKKRTVKRKTVKKKQTKKTKKKTVKQRKVKKKAKRLSKTDRLMSEAKRLLKN